MMTRTDPAITNRLELKPFDYCLLGANVADEMRDGTGRIPRYPAAKRREDHGYFPAWGRMTPNTSQPDLDGENNE
jgi:hypothetical protein